MKKKFLKLIYFIIVAIIILFITFIFIFYGKVEEELESDDWLVNLETDSIELIFYDNKTSCPLDGNIYFGNNLLGESQGGVFLLSKENYDNFWGGGAVSIKGLTNYCFGENTNLPFVEYWEISDLDYYFEYEEPVEFETTLTPRQPRYLEEMQGFIRPYEITERLSKIGIDKNDSHSENIEKILGHTYMNYVSDIGRFRELEYWQTPSDFIKNKGGDCEDWAIYAVSLLRGYDSNLNCYAASWYTHMNVLCQINNLFIILDQDKIRKNVVLDEKLSFQENQIEARSWRNNYFKDYGIAPDERILFYLFNEEKVIEFENGQEDFIAWVLETGGIKK